MAFDPHANFSYSTILTPPSPATSGVTIVLQAGDGAKFPAASFNATVWPAGQQPTAANAEIVRVTVIAVDTFTITRAQESSAARAIVAGDQFAATITKKTLTDIEAAVASFPISVANGGTGVSTLAAHGLLIGNAAGNIVVSGAGTAGQVLFSNGASADPTFQALTSLVLDKSTTEQDVNTSTAETSVYSFSVPGGTLLTANTLRFTLIGSYLNNTGGNQNLFIATKFGGTVIAGATSAGGAVGGGGYATSALAHPVKLEVLINANGATNSQRVNANLIMGAAQADIAWGATAEVTEHHVQHTSLAIDTTSAQTFTITVTHGASNAALSFKRFAAILERLG